MEQRYQPKQVVLVRTDIEMPAGKLAPQVAHACMKCILDAGQFSGNSFQVSFSPEVTLWFRESFTKVCLGVDSPEMLHALVDRAKAAGLWTAVIVDEGRTVFKEPTLTCAAIGPAPYEKIQPITGHLKLYRGYIKKA